MILALDVGNSHIFGGLFVDGELAVRSTVTVTLAADHRASDGRTGARFLAAMGDVLTRPEEL